MLSGAAETTAVSTLLQSVDSVTPFVTFRIDATRINSTIDVLVKAIGQLQSSIGGMHDKLKEHDTVIESVKSQQEVTALRVEQLNGEIDTHRLETNQKLQAVRDDAAKLDRRVSDIEQRLNSTENFAKDIDRIDHQLSLITTESRTAKRTADATNLGLKEQTERLDKVSRNATQVTSAVDGLYAVFEVDRETARTLALTGKSGAQDTASSGPAGGRSKSPGKVSSGGLSQDSLSSAAQYALSLPSLDFLGRNLEGRLDALKSDVEAKHQVLRARVNEDLAAVRAKLADKCDERVFLQFKADVEGQMRKLLSLQGHIDRLGDDVSRKVDKSDHLADIGQLQQTKADRFEMMDLATRDEVRGAFDKVGNLEHAVDGFMGRVSLEMKGVSDKARDASLRASEAGQRAAAVAATSTKRRGSDTDSPPPPPSIIGGTNTTVVRGVDHTEDINDLVRRVEVLEAECERLEAVKADKSAISDLHTQIRKLSEALAAAEDTPRASFSQLRPTSAGGRPSSASGRPTSASGCLPRSASPGNVPLPDVLLQQTPGKRVLAPIHRPSSAASAGGANSARSESLRPPSPNMVYTSLPATPTPDAVRAPSGASTPLYDSDGRRTTACLGAAKMVGTMADHYENMQRGATGSERVPQSYRFKVLE